MSFRVRRKHIFGHFMFPHSRLFPVWEHIFTKYCHENAITRPRINRRLNKNQHLRNHHQL